MDEPKTIGGRIRQARKRKKLTQVDLAAAICVERSHLTNVENGRASLSLQKLAAVANETGTTVAWLIGEADSSGDPARHNLLAAYDKTDDRGREVLLRVAQSLLRDASARTEPGE